MTTTPDHPSTALPGRPPVVDRATWQAARNELLVREKAHTRAGDALAAARHRLPMVEVDATAQVPYGRGEAWEDNPEGWPEGRQACWYWRTDADGTPPGERPAAPCRSGPALGRPPWRPSAGAAT